MASNRAEIFRFAVDALGDPDVIQLPEGAGPFRRITASLQSDGVGWTLSAPNADSNSKSFSIGAEYVFENGPYVGLDILGYVEIPSGANFLILFCER